MSKLAFLALICEGKGLGVVVNMLCECIITGGWSVEAVFVLVYKCVVRLHVFTVELSSTVHFNEVALWFPLLLSPWSSYHFWDITVQSV